MDMDFDDVFCLLACVGFVVFVCLLSLEMVLCFVLK